MRINSVNNAYYLNSGYRRLQTQVNFTSNVNVAKIKPALDPNAAMNEFLAKTMKISKLRYQELIPELKSATEEITFNFKKTKTYGLDINPNNRKKYAVILHGLGQNITNLQPLYKSIINKTDYAIIAPEYRGFGRNEVAKVNDKTLLEDAQAAINYLKDKGIDSKDICIIGHSLGGFVASGLAAANPEISSLILVSSAESLTNKSMNNLNISIPKFTKFIYKHFPALQNSTFRKINTVKNLKNVEMPVYIIHSEKDKIISSDVAQHLANACKNLQSVEILPNGGHAIDSDKIDKIIQILD